MQSVLSLPRSPCLAWSTTLKGIYTATAALMICMAVLLLIDLAWRKRIPTMHGLSALLVFAFGAATLILHNQRFIQWKPTVLFWLVSVAFLGSFWIGERTLTERLLGTALGEPVNRSAAAVAPAQCRLGGLLRPARRSQPAGGLQCQRTRLGEFQAVRPDRGDGGVCRPAAAWLARQLPRAATT